MREGSRNSYQGHLIMLCPRARRTCAAGAVACRAAQAAAGWRQVRNSKGAQSRSTCVCKRVNIHAFGVWVCVRVCLRASGRTSARAHARVLVCSYVRSTNGIHDIMKQWGGRLTSAVGAVVRRAPPSQGARAGEAAARVGAHAVGAAEAGGRCALVDVGCAFFGCMRCKGGKIVRRLRAFRQSVTRGPFQGRLCQGAEPRTRGRTASPPMQTAPLFVGLVQPGLQAHE